MCPGLAAVTHLIRSTEFIVFALSALSIVKTPGECQEKEAGG
jgi:hypothetical protein